MTAEDAPSRQPPSSNKIKPLQSWYQPCSQWSATMTAATASRSLWSGHAGECVQLTWLTSASIGFELYNDRDG
jgi:hypothetical protein